MVLFDTNIDVNMKFKKILHKRKIYFQILPG